MANYTNFTSPFPISTVNQFIIDSAINRLEPEEKVLPDIEPLNYDFSSYSARLDSFNDPSWTCLADEKYSPARLAAAGFFSIRYLDIVQCYHCGGCFGNWENSGLTPWQAHAGWHPQCPLVQSVKGDEFISESRAKVAALHPAAIENLEEIFPTGFPSIVEAIYPENPTLEKHLKLW